MMLGQVTYPGLFFQRDTKTGVFRDLQFGRGYEGPWLNYRKIEKLEKDALFLAWIQNPLFERISRALIAGDIAIYRAVLMNKGRQGGTVLPWHQDGGLFWGVDRDPILQIWTALDDAPEEAGCVEVFPGATNGARRPYWRRSPRGARRTSRGERTAGAVARSRRRSDPHS